MSFWLGIATVCSVFVLAGVASRQLQQALGVLSVAHGAVMGVGAYVYAIVGLDPSFSFFALPVAIAASASAAVLLSYATRRVVGDQHAVSTFAVQTVFVALLLLCRPVTRGALGISSIPPLPGAELLGGTGAGLAWCLIGAAALFLCEARARSGPFWMACAVVSRSRELAGTLGLRTDALRAQMALLYGAGLGLAGSAMASYVTFVDPFMFGAGMSVTVLAVAFLANKRRFVGAVAGPIVIVGLPEVARLFDLPSGRAAYLQVLLAGLGVCLAVCLTSPRVRATEALP